MKKYTITFFIALAFSLTFFSCGDKKNEAGEISSLQTNANAGAATTTLVVSGTSCGRCVGIITNALTVVPGVRNVSVNLRNNRTGVVTVTHDQKLNEAEIRRAIIEDAGYDVIGKM